MYFFGIMLFGIIGGFNKGLLVMSLISWSVSKSDFLDMKDFSSEFMEMFYMVVLREELWFDLFLYLLEYTEKPVL